MMRWCFSRKAGLLLLLSLLGLGLLAACDGRQPYKSPVFHSVDITGAHYADGVSLPDAEGQLRHFSEFKGKVVMLFFGYTQCPDVCPTTLAEIAALRQALGEQGQKIQPIFVTLDPERDTPPLLKAYLANFGADVVGLRGNMAQTQEVAKSFNVYYSTVKGKTPDSYTLDHTAGTYIFDKAGRIRLFARYGIPAEQLQQDVAALMKSE
jgi:protein SCO1/2